MSILDNIEDFAKDHGVNLDDGLGLDDLAAVGEDIKGMAEKVGLPEDLVNKVLGK